MAYAYRLDNGTNSLIRLNGILSSITTLTTDPKSPSTVYAGTQSGIFEKALTQQLPRLLAGGLPSGALFLLSHRD